jgi:hypothetical protein
LFNIVHWKGGEDMGEQWAELKQALLAKFHLESAKTFVSTYGTNPGRTAHQQDLDSAYNRGRKDAIREVLHLMSEADKNTVEK